MAAEDDPDTDADETYPCEAKTAITHPKAAELNISPFGNTAGFMLLYCNKQPEYLGTLVINFFGVRGRGTTAASSRPQQPTF